MYNNTDKGANREKGLYLGNQIIWYVLSVIEVFLLLRFVLKLLGANPNAGFTQLVYNVGGFLNEPFNLIFSSSTPVSTGTTFEWSILVGMLVYWLIAIGIIRLFGMGRKVTTEEAHNDLEKNS
ncbi:YggT family protein [Candidatus Gracilibacteria bacterium]|nr:YggT family protein [Candidatus Gracilibacteria bacterium]